MPVASPRQATVDKLAGQAADRDAVLQDRARTQKAHAGKNLRPQPGRVRPGLVQMLRILIQLAAYDHNHTRAKRHQHMGPQAGGMRCPGALPAHNQPDRHSRQQPKNNVPSCDRLHMGTPFLFLLAGLCDSGPPEMTHSSIRQFSFATLQ